MELGEEYIVCIRATSENIIGDFPGTINKLEEMMMTGATVSYGSITISTETRLQRGMVSTLSTRLSTPESPSPSPGIFSVF